MIAMLCLEFPVNEIFVLLRAEVIVNFVQSTTYLDLSISSQYQGKFWFLLKLWFGGRITNPCDSVVSLDEYRN